MAPILHQAGDTTEARLAKVSLWVLCFWLASMRLGQGGELRIERMFGPEIKTGPYKHPARLEQLHNGDLYAVYYGGAGEYAIDIRLAA